MIERAVISITDDCNLKCIHCYNSKNYHTSRSQSKLEFDKLIEQLYFLGLKQISISGGEPLLYFGKVLEIAEVCKTFGISTILTTNGTLLNNDNIPILLDKYIDFIQISIDGYDKYTHEQIRGENSFEHIERLLQLDSFNKFKQRIVPMYTINSINYNTIDKYISKMCEIGFEKCGFERYIPCNGQNIDKLELNIDSLLHAYNILYHIEKEKNVEIHVNDPIYNVFKLEKSNTNIGFLKSTGLLPTCGCSAYRNSVYIDANGFVYPCTFMIQPILDLSNDNLYDLKKIYIDELETHKNSECAECDYAIICGGCKAYSMLQYGTYLRKDPLCLLEQMKLKA